MSKLDHHFWAKYFKVYDVLNMVIPYQELLDTIVKELEVKKGDLVLDAGCGTGNLGIKLKAKGAKVIGIDYCIEALDVYKLKDPEAEVMVHDLTQPLPFPDNYFDKIASNNVIYAIKNVEREKILTEFRRVLKPKGNVVIVNPKMEFNNYAILSEHLQEEISEFGLIKTVLKVFLFLPKLIKMLHYNSLIKKNGSGIRGSRFIKMGEQAELLSATGFMEVSEGDAYRGESLLARGIK